MSSHPPPSADPAAIVAYHNALKTDARWAALPSVGIQDFGSVVLELRNCVRCRSTLAKKVR